MTEQSEIRQNYRCELQWWQDVTITKFAERGKFTVCVSVTMVAMVGLKIIHIIYVSIKS